MDCMALMSVSGPQIGINLSPENIVYTSGGPGKLPAFGTDLQQQQQIRNVLKGKNNFGINFHLGYDLEEEDSMSICNIIMG